ncbi:hypothetical protein CF319_g1168 [Tilletia indica]|nr:hypothetical protein CF319_g1168 [Tilletia indica]
MDIDSSTSSLHDRAATRRQSSAVEKVWRTAELATQILSYLVRERIDLIACSTVSKYFRALALPLLVQILDVPLSTASRTCHFFEANPKVADVIKYIRIWDDKWLYRSARTKTADGSIHVYDSEEERDPNWMKIAHLFDLILKSRTKEQLPLLDITIGLASISALSVMLQRHEHAARRVAALEIVPCEVPPELAYLDTLEQNLKVAELLTVRWRQLGLLVTEMCNASANTDSPALKRFQISGIIFRWCADAEFWHCLKRALPATVQDLVLRLPSNVSHLVRAGVLLETEWPHLRAFTFDLGTPDGQWQSRIDHFFARHQHLENITFTSAKITPEITISSTFPKLKGCHIQMMTDNSLTSFLSRNFHTIRDLTVPPSSSLPHSLSTFLPHPTLDKNASDKGALHLDVLHARAGIAASLVRSGVTVRHYDFDYVSSIKELGLDDWLFPVREAAEAVTCLDIAVISNNTAADTGGDDTYTLGARFLPAGALPNLTELVICWQDQSQVICRKVDGGALIAEALATLKHQKFLRHLRLEHADGMPFPPGPNTVLEVENSDQIPPRLEYITWHSPEEDRTQRYRVMLPAQPDLATDNTVGGMETQRPPLKIRLQRLPEMFADRPDKRGVWHRPQRLWREGNTIFDHSKSPPELYV